jgi:serine phosphatase RsbU (regulator of sigma subunit)
MPAQLERLVICDVAGHDRTAAAAMGQTRNLLRGLTYGLGEPPAAILTALDNAMQHFNVGSLATAILARASRPPRTPPVAAAGCAGPTPDTPPPLLVPPDGTAELLHTPSDLLLGVLPGGLRIDHEALLPVGSTLLLYTDGLVERRDENLDDGLARLQSVVRDIIALHLETFCDELIDRMAHIGDDDVALLALRAHDPEKPRPPDAGREVLHPH